MTEFIQFLKDYGEYILSAISAILCLIAIIVKRKPKTLDEFLSLVSESLSYVPGLVSLAEEEIGSGNGEKKKEYVLSEVVKQVCFGMKRRLTDSEIAIVRDRASIQIENVLTAPEKKKE